MLAMFELPSRPVMNRAIWSVGLVLQAALVWVVFRRGVARRFPGFTALIVLYPLRAALLFALGMLELALQAWVVVEIVLRLARAAGGWTGRRSIALLGLVAIALSLTVVTFHLLPAEQSADRVQIMAGFLMIGLFAAALKMAVSRNLVLIPAGFAAFAAMQLASLAGCGYAGIHHNADAFVAWSYVPACGYLGVVAFWLAALRREAVAG
jgi:hypothetical protein